MAARVDAALERIEHGHGGHGGQFGESVARELLTQKAGNHAGQALGGLERHVAHKAVANNDVGRALEDVVAFHIAVKVQRAALPGAAQQLAGALDFFVALDGFFADVEQAHARVGRPAQRRDQCRAEHGKLQQMLGRAVHIRAQIKHGSGAAVRVGHGIGDGRALDALGRFEHIARNGHERAGIARRKGHLRLALLDLLDGHAHGGVLFAAQRHFHGVVHADHFGGGHHARAGVGKARQRLGPAHQQQAGLGVILQKLLAGGQRDLRATVAAHAVNGQNGHAVCLVFCGGEKGKGAGDAAEREMKCAMRSTKCETRNGCA